MFVDVQNEDATPTDDFDICIVGAGAAGISCALTLNNSSLRVCVLEAGGLQYSAESQSIYEGQIIGLPYEDLDVCRLRYFGGTTNHWSGYCAPFTNESLKKKSWIPHSGWPIDMSDLAEYFERTIDLFDLPRIPWDADRGWKLDHLQPKIKQPRLNFDKYGFQENSRLIYPTRLGHGVYLEDIRNSKNIQVHLNANVVEIAAAENGKSIEGLKVRTFSGKNLYYKAQVFILAASGIENARLMLASNSQISEGIGNQNDLVGRFFSDHGVINLGRVATSHSGVDIDFYNERPIQNGEVMVWHESSAETEQKYELTPSAFRMRRMLHEAMQLPGGEAIRSIGQQAIRGTIPINFSEKIGDVLSDFDDLAKFGTNWLWNGTTPANEFKLELHFEPAPNPESRVILSSESDALGIPRVQLDWQITETDYRTIKWLIDNCSRALAATNVGRVQIEIDESNIDKSIEMAKHHVGTTRMADSASAGVVDKNCKVFGIENLYVAGSSVFTTCGSGSPTMMIAVLAQRLGDHLKTEIL